MNRVRDLTLESVISDPGAALSVVVDSVARNVSTELYFLLLMLAFIALGIAVDAASGRNLRTRYLHKGFLVDALYAGTALSHVLQSLIMVPAIVATNGLLDRTVPWLKIQGLALTNPVLAFFAAKFAFDFFQYWAHRFYHQNIYLWQIHRIHHSCEQLNAFAALRSSIFEDTLSAVIFAVIFYAVSAAPPHPLALLLLFNGLTFINHSGLGWTWGPLGRIFVSPAFHGVHHSREPHHLNCNYGSALSIWDRMFGTAVEPDGKPVRWGLAHDPLPQNFLYQQIAPLVDIWRVFRSRHSETTVNA